jgi:hypothetical protein
MLKQSITIDQVIEFLNELVQQDEKVCRAMYQMRIPCNRTLVDNSPIQCRNEEFPTTSMLGILNGMFGQIESGPRKGWGPICVIPDEDNHIKGFNRVK